MSGKELMYKLVYTTYTNIDTSYKHTPCPYNPPHMHTIQTHYIVTFSTHFHSIHTKHKLTHIHTNIHKHKTHTQTYTSTSRSHLYRHSNLKHICVCIDACVCTCMCVYMMHMYIYATLHHKQTYSMCWLVLSQLGTSRLGRRDLH